MVGVRDDRRRPANSPPESSPDELEQPIILQGSVACVP